MIPQQLDGFLAKVSRHVSVSFLLLCILFGDDPRDIEGLRVRFAATRRQGNSAYKLTHVRRHNDPVADAKIEIPSVAQLRDAPSGQPNVY
jgi:hypothetical protein